MIEFINITKQYTETAALQAVNLRVDSHELFVLVGPSGSGKTTLLKTVNRLVVPTSGQVLLDGVDVAAGNLQTLRRHIGYVLQSSALFPNMTVMQNAAVQLEALGWPKAKIRPRLEHLLRLVDLDPKLYADRRPAQLSGGEAQRVGIVRALAANPTLMLMDEPFSALDPVAKRQLQALILRLHQQLDTTILFVTHDMQEALRLADRMAVLHNGQLQQVGEPHAILARPANAFVADFFKDVSASERDLAQVLAAGFGVPRSGGGEPWAAGASIYDWAAALQANPTLVVQVAGRELRSGDLIGYLATLAKEAAHA
ncbi:ABC transporter ATP-binding protein [Lacticaseibacillus parakribbianus]|uniref:ABC transporter ATP-binding protein n=1 Tax=Lacticaseibacillus parakribbianus TaxID=2970927 RepID=UPI0021CB7217